MSFNLVILCGNITRDIEVKFTKGGTAYCDFGIAVNKVYYDAKGEKKESVCFVDCVAWDKGAEWAGKHLKKGAEVHLMGELTLDQWEDKETGGKRSKLKVTVHKLTPTFGTWKDGEGLRERTEEGTRTQSPGPSKREAPPRDPDIDPVENESPF